MEKKENTGTKLNVLLCNLVDYVRGDDRPLVFAVMQEITEYFDQELDKAREEGRRRESLEWVYKKFCEWEMSKDLSKEQKEMFDDLLSELSKLKDNK